MPAIKASLATTCQVDSHKCARWSWQRDLNSQHSTWKADALPFELYQHKCKTYFLYSIPYDLHHFLTELPDTPYIFPMANILHLLIKHFNSSTDGRLTFLLSLERQSLHFPCFVMPIGLLHKTHLSIYSFGE